MPTHFWVLGLFPVTLYYAVQLCLTVFFLFSQELPKYLRGYHSVSKEDMISLAGLLLRIQIDSDKSQFVMIPRMLKDLVPADQQNIMTVDDWKKVILKPLIYYMALYVCMLCMFKSLLSVVFYS